MATGSSSCGGNWRPVDAVSNKFPSGMRVLVVDDDLTCLAILERMLQSCLYEVTKCNRAEIALSLLQENKNGYDVVISDVHMPDMDGFHLLEHVVLEIDLPVIMISADDSKAVVMKGVTHGACDYLIKPVRMDALKNIWQHVVRKKKHEWRELELSKREEEVENKQSKQTEDGDYSSLANEGSWRNLKKGKLDEEDLDNRDDSSTLKKPRVIWSVELHQQFLAAVNQRGIDKAVPKKILELMNVPGLSRVNVASHLQKYKLYLKKINEGVWQHSGALNIGFMGSQDGPFGNMSSFSGLDLQGIWESGHLPAQSLATLQSTVSDKGNSLSVMAMHNNSSGSGIIQPPPLHLRTPNYNVFNDIPIGYDSNYNVFNDIHQRIGYDSNYNVFNDIHQRIGYDSNYNVFNDIHHQPIGYDSNYNVFDNVFNDIHHPKSHEWEVINDFDSGWWNEY